MAREQRDSYHGSVAIWVDGIKRFDVDASLTSYVEVVEVETPEGTQRKSRAISWGGHLEGLSNHNRLELVGRRLELRLPDERSGAAVMPDNSGAVRGSGEPPFAVVRRLEPYS